MFPSPFRAIPELHNLRMSAVIQPGWVTLFTRLLIWGKCLLTIAVNVQVNCSTASLKFKLLQSGHIAFSRSTMRASWLYFLKFLYLISINLGSENLFFISSLTKMGKWSLLLYLTTLWWSAVACSETHMWSIRLSEDFDTLWPVQ